MAPSKAERPAIAKAMKRGAGIDQLGRKIDFEATKNNWNLQYLARRFGLPPPVAAIPAFAMAAS